MKKYTNQMLIKPDKKVKFTYTVMLSGYVIKVTLNKEAARDMPAHKWGALIYMKFTAWKGEIYKVVKREMITSP